MKRLWTPEEEAVLKKIYKTMTAKQLAEHFGRSVHVIQVKCFHLGLKKGYDHAKIQLSFDDKLWLRLNFPHMRNELCAMRLGVSLRTVVRLARSMRLEKTPQFMKDSQAFASRKAQESHIRNGTYPAKGYYSPNLQKRWNLSVKTNLLVANNRKLDNLRKEFEKL
ncbi:hypothetical protein EEL33_01140 [Muribaculaceae bacterium Isolate-037 (Harlan)]|nr:hypothetical protein EEL33_01140 [Muribaculaceae bacterium Isolate-037 (Harlan)]